MITGHKRTELPLKRFSEHYDSLDEVLDDIAAAMNIVACSEEFGSMNRQERGRLVFNIQNVSRLISDLQKELS